MRAPPGGVQSQSSSVTDLRLPSSECQGCSMPSNASSRRYRSCSTVAPLMLLLEVHPPVDVDLGAGDVIALGDQEAAEGRHLLRFAEARQRDLCYYRLLVLFRQVSHHLGLDEARTHGVDRDVEAGELLRRRFRETDH